MTELVITEVTIKLLVDKLRLRWGMPIKNGHWLWPHGELQVRLYATPFDDLNLGRPELLNMVSATKQSGRGISVNIAKLFDFSAEKMNTAMRTGMTFSDEYGRCAVIYIDVTDERVPAGAVVVYPELEWPATTDQSFSAWVQFGYERNGQFEVVKRIEPIVHDPTTQPATKSPNKEPAQNETTEQSSGTTTESGEPNMTFDSNLYRDVVDFITPHMSSSGMRQAWINRGFFGQPVVNNINLSGAAGPFASHLIDELKAYDGVNAIITLLQTMRADMGPGRQREIDALIARLEATRDTN